MSTILQVVAWALWYQRELANREWLESDFDGDEGCWSFNAETWRSWLLQHAHEPPKLHQTCDCGGYRQLCAWQPPNGRQGGKSLVALNAVMKHYHPDHAIGALAALEHPLFALIDK